MNPEINRLPNGGRDRVGFVFTWRHKDGSIVTFCTDGWSSSDPEKSAWLNEMARLTSSVPCIPPFVRVWLEHECRLIEGHGPDFMNRPLG